MISLAYPLLEEALDLEENKVHILAIEQPKAFRRLVWDMMEEEKGLETEILFSKDFKHLHFSKVATVLLHPLEADPNHKKIMTKALLDLQQLAVSAELYSETCQLLGTVDTYLRQLLDEADTAFSYTAPDIGALLKAAGIHFETAHGDMLGSICDYMQLLNRYCGIEVFVCVLFRGYFDKAELTEWYRFARYNKLQLLLLEQGVAERLEGEEVITFDEDLCRIT